MKKKLCMALTLAMLALTFVGCGKAKEQSLTAQTDTIIVKEKGGFVGYIVEPFDEAVYSFDNFKQMVNSEIEDYNSQAGESVTPITLTTCELEEGVVTVSITYDSAQDFAAFNQEIFFCGTVSEALGLEIDYDEISMKTAGKEDLFSAADLLGQEDMAGKTVLITNDPSNIRGARKIEYLGVGDVLVDDSEADTDDAQMIHIIVFK